MFLNFLDFLNIKLIVVVFEIPFRFSIKPSLKFEMSVRCKKVLEILNLSANILLLFLWKVSLFYIYSLLPLDICFKTDLVRLSILDFLCFATYRCCHPCLHYIHCFLIYHRWGWRKCCNGKLLGIVLTLKTEELVGRISLFCLLQ